MRSTITARGQTVIPSKIRQYFHLSPSDRLEWIVDGSVIRVIPVKTDCLISNACRYPLNGYMKIKPYRKRRRR